MEGAHGSGSGQRGKQRKRMVAEKEGVFDWGEPASAAEISTQISRLEAEMYEQAKNLAFEDAANTRDKLAALREALLLQKA